ncbi:uncharacterized protein LOC125210959 [Salvia hispanica]|uniref:uncharacterized protein LOC125210959 n=1 Tax=Salvia hispanica TaxID=49212 RepID=UPI002009AD1D|nr:uncharacterized protein LOC125210959 [Salvia hispanica]
MGRRKKSVASYFCGVFFRKRPPAVEDDDGGEECPDPSTASSDGVRGDGTMTPEDAAAAKPCSPEQAPSLPMPPGNRHMRTASCGHNLQHRRTGSSVSRLVSSMSLRSMGGGGGAAEKPSARIRERARIFKHEDSVWKKTIILGERCRVPEDEDEDDVKLFDEKGNKIITYHPKSHSGLLQYSRQSTSLDADHDFRTNLKL